MKFQYWKIAALVAVAAPAHADGSYLLPDGTNRASAVTLHCVGPGGSAVPCGTAASPLAVAVAPGLATAVNQSSQVLAEQASALALGTPGDGAYAGGPGTMTAVLKGVWSLLSTGVAAVPVGGVPVSRSTSLPAQQSVAVFPANSARRYIAFQAPQTTYVWVNFTGGVAAPNAPDCAYFSAGALYESGPWVSRGIITVYAPVAVSIAAWEN